MSANSNIKRFSANGVSKCEDCAAINKKVDVLTDTVQQQNLKICQILAEHKVLLNQLLQKDKVIDDVMKICPINSESELQELEKLLINQKDLYVRYMKSVLKGDVSKNLGEILGREIVMTFNAEGVQGKKRLKNFKNVYDALTNEISDERPEEKFKLAPHHQKNKYHKLNSKNKSKENRAELNGEPNE